MPKMNEYIRTWDNANRKWVYLHRVIAEKMIGRKLTARDVVHHINGNVKDNRPENLKVLTHATHFKTHRQIYVSCTVDGCPNKHHAKGLCKKHYRLRYPERHYSNKELTRRGLYVL